MNLTELTPMLWVDDVKSTMDFYVRVLKFEAGNFVEEWNWGVVQKGPVKIMLARYNEHNPWNGPVFTGSLYLRTDDANEWWEHLKDTGAVFYPIEDFEWGMREFAIRDCNGYILQFGQDISGENKSLL
jgi:uncharacterized glyoxalase superfamily protein PhnB